MSTTTSKRRPLRAMTLLVAGVYTLGVGGFLLLRAFLQHWTIDFLANFTPFYFLPLVVLLPLTLIVGGKRIAVLQAALLLLALVWYGRYYLPKATVTPPEDAPTLRVASFNMWGNNQRLDEMHDWLREQDADMVLLQEVPPTYATGEPLADLYPHRFGQPGVAWGNVTLSRYPLQTTEYFENTGIQRVTVEVKSQPVVVYNVHLPMPVREAPRLQLPLNHWTTDLALSYDEHGRNDVLRRLLDDWRDETLPMIAAGDFNMSDQSRVYNEVGAVLFDSYREAGYGLGLTWPVSHLEELPILPDGMPPLVRIDYVWHSDEFVALDGVRGPVIGASLGSDHLPLAATLVLAQTDAQ